MPGAHGRAMPVVSKGRVRILNRTKGTLLASCAEVADSIGSRLIGLLGRSSLESGGGMWILPGNSIHTIGMCFPIDIVMLSRETTVVGLRKSVPPFSVVWPNLRARSVLELPADTIARTRTESGDLLQIETRSS